MQLIVLKEEQNEKVKLKSAREKVKNRVWK